MDWTGYIAKPVGLLDYADGEFELRVAVLSELSQLRHEERDGRTAEDWRQWFGRSGDGRKNCGSTPSLVSAKARRAVVDTSVQRTPIDGIKCWWMFDDIRSTCTGEGNA